MLSVLLSSLRMLWPSSRPFNGIVVPLYPSPLTPFARVAQPPCNGFTPTATSKTTGLLTLAKEGTTEERVGRPAGYPKVKIITKSKQHSNCLFVGCLTSQQQTSVSQGRICSDNFMCCHTEIEVADQTFYLTQSQYTDTGPTSPSADPISPGAWQGSHWSANF